MSSKIEIINNIDKLNKTSFFHIKPNFNEIKKIKGIIIIPAPNAVGLIWFDLIFGLSIKPIL